MVVFNQPYSERLIVKLNNQPSLKEVTSRAVREKNCPINTNKMNVNLNFILQSSFDLC